ncbi:MAG: 16S rRNA (adenine(1518)-N(6)/adenine(1519)-N(6))-dimethyltransferase RsmA [Endozoicomonadaceae bacterium]|nr:16S rRNA (adenine(1518)-N(6)/adenine(1519)-N(6))-dimethyltransferase RsmA [Endozoicomonadaceae bacterium]
MSSLPSGTHKARKRFGQNFLQNQMIIHQIVEAICPKKNEHLIEIGPGQGALTQPLLDAAEHLDVVEIDRDLVQQLKMQFAAKPGLKIYEGDALKFDFSTLKKDEKPLRLVGNLPYNISTPLLFHLLRFTPLIQDMHFMLQKEVADRLTAQQSEKNYGRLSIMTQYHCATEMMFYVGPEAFHPQPKVESAIVRLIPYRKPPFHCVSLARLEKIVCQAFSQRRKTLRKSLRHIISADELIRLYIDPGLRPENLSVKQFVIIANSCT